MLEGNDNTLNLLVLMDDDQIKKILSDAVEELNNRLRGKLPLVIIIHRSYGRFYLRWKATDGSGKRLSSYTRFALAHDSDTRLIAHEIQLRVDYINAQIGLIAKHSR